MSYSEGLLLSSIKVLKHSLLFVRLDLNQVPSIIDFNMPEFNMKKKYNCMLERHVNQNFNGFLKLFFIHIKLNMQTLNETFCLFAFFFHEGNQCFIRLKLKSQIITKNTCFSFNINKLFFYSYWGFNIHWIQIFIEWCYCKVNHANPWN